MYEKRTEKNKILAVDDERSNLLALMKILTDEFELSVVTSGTRAIEAVAANKPDLILLDVILGDMLGFDVIKKLKSNRETADIPVIFITGLDGHEHEIEGLGLGAADYIHKPFVPQIVLLRVRTQLRILNAMREIERLTNTDALTELANRRSFDKQLETEWGRAIREKTPISLIMLDADKFKQYNDTYGHPQGDKLLKTIGGILKEHTKRPADLAARIGGEEFGVLLPNTDINGAALIAESIRVSVSKTVVMTEDGATTSVTISAGVTCAELSPFSPVSPKEFVAAADALLYRAKNEGRNMIVVTPT